MPPEVMTQLGIAGIAVSGMIKLYNDQKSFTAQVIEDGKKEREEQNQFINKIMEESKSREDALKQIITDQNSIITVKLEEVLDRLEEK